MGKQIFNSLTVRKETWSVKFVESLITAKMFRAYFLHVAYNIRVYYNF